MRDFFTQLFGGETVFFQIARSPMALNFGIHDADKAV